ncbi:acyl-CoA dehydrogenase [Streptomyces sp. CB00316]|uniref:acyl-CoA dehydrogenase family protein n=1 Tax=unclassified Streptomyces TaxID=2593676 RepID=UPI00093E4CA7|nr:MULTISPECIES: acyl-CoA dehydrogenase family protein [unclassified Streptomyces]MBT2379717.1 acyl-CoA dehydrogenase family protein [Streptomyces sp. ISL-111]MBT2426349.1 acyl-CoA dehydrogenase family protein [Streptomyces sp. ISL-112]MBT2465288.1 acyl-CoA dehydrogenase family protein [Streptomyces sp. ISL-63]OKJ09397.1 acyl-CoA dehydrogenase [Streptomyces sp. CB00316]
MTETGNVARGAAVGYEADVTPAVLIERARAMVPDLVARQQETEQRTYYAEDTHRAFRDAGFYRITVPKRYGGYEFGFDTFLQVAMVLCRACPSTGWMFCLGAAHSLFAGSMFEEKAQAEIFGGGDFIAPLVNAPYGTATRAEDGGWILDGVWRYCSGAPYATHLIGNTVIAGDDANPPRRLLFIAPRDQWEMLDDWGGQLGLKGSGSHSIRISGGHIPDHFGIVVNFEEISVTEGTPGRELHAHPQYGGAPASSMALEGAHIAVGMCQGALDAYTELMFSRTTIIPPFVPRAEDPDFQLWYGKASGMIDAAETLVLAASRRWHELSGLPVGAFTAEEDMRIAITCREATELAWRAVDEILQPTAGSHAVREGTRLERVWRDLSTGRTHASSAVLLTTVANRGFAQLRLASARRRPAPDA